MKFSARSICIKKTRPVLLLLGIIFSLAFDAGAYTVKEAITGPEVTSTREQAIAYVDNIKELKPSSSWPNIVPQLFLQNLKTNVRNPISIYPGKGTNFCGYGALTYLFLKDDPLGYAKLLMQLYQDGKAKFKDVYFDPSPAVKLAAGQLKYKGLLDINPAEQMWFLTLAGHFKGYLNIFNRKYDPGDEDRFWASVNYAKFNRMARSLLHYKVRARGTDLMRPKGIDLYNYITEAMKTGPVVLFINNRIVHKKDHVTLKLQVPTHFVVAERISKTDDVITLMYWDYGGKTQMQLSTGFLKRIVFGISNFTATGTNVE